LSSTTILSTSTVPVTTTPVPSSTPQGENGTKETEKTVVKNRGFLNTSDYNCHCDVTVSSINRLM
jgi:hypothetical protein